MTSWRAGHPRVCKAQEDDSGGDGWEMMKTGGDAADAEAMGDNNGDDDGEARRGDSPRDEEWMEET